MSPAAAKYTRETCEETVQTLCGGGNGIKKSSQKIGDAPYRFTFQFPRISPENVGGAQQQQRQFHIRGRIMTDRQTLPTPSPPPLFARGFITNQLFMIQKQFDCITSTINVTMSQKQKRREIAPRKRQAKCAFQLLMAGIFHAPPPHTLKNNNKKG
jgi:hypothetical protein